MLFCSLAYLAFFAAVFALYWSLPGRRARVWLLLIASFCFYASWNRWLALLVFACTVVDYLLARGMDAWQKEPLRRLLLALSLLMNLGLLCYFKYANFFLQSLQEGLRLGGVTASLPLLSVILPVGISFYTFEAINYTVDVYRRRIPAERDLGHFLLFITFFPHLVAGPIVRARDFLPQVRAPKRWSWPRTQLGVQLFLLGFFKKVAIADRLAFFVDPVFADPSAFGSGASWLALLAYALQIYCDFSGYSDMALGSAHLLGYKLAQNFDLPYLSANVAEFWRRWHMSLSTWLRDYLFIPLGGSRGGRRRTARNLLLAMTLGGLWHGANWTFVLWGLIHGWLLILQRGFRSWCAARPGLDGLLRGVAGTAARTALTFLAVSLCWVLFRATSLPAALTVFAHLFRPHAGLPAPLPVSGLWVLIGLAALAHGAARLGAVPALLRRLPAPALGLGYAVTLTLALVLAPGSEKAFIYFQF
jgi:alginate O-acetyltransferase complex protein AlgI